MSGQKADSDAAAAPGRDPRGSGSAFPLAGKTAIVSGASRGIGRAIALRLGALGACLLLTAREAGSLATAADAIRQSGGEADVLAGNLRDKAFADAVVGHAMTRFGRVDILVNNAGDTVRGSILDVADEGWSDGFGLKLFGAVRLSRAAWGHLAATGGNIVNIAGAGGRTPNADFAIGGAVNAAMLALTKSMAELGIRDGVRVNAVNPGKIKTDRLMNWIRAKAETEGISLEEAELRIRTEAGSALIGDPDDIAGLVAYIVMPSGRLFQGALIDADAGMTKSI